MLYCVTEPVNKLNISSKKVLLVLGSKGHTFSYENESHFYYLLSSFKFVEIPLTSARIATCISERN
jgi:hypothetical protein